MNWTAFLIAYGAFGLLGFLLALMVFDTHKYEKHTPWDWFAWKIFTASCFLALCIGIGLGV